MFFQSLVKCSAGQLLLHRGGGENLRQWPVPIHTRLFFVSKGFSCTFEQRQWSGVFHYSKSNIQRSFILVRNCVVRNNTSYFIFISDFSDFVSFSEQWIG
jgi:hypothetical protein